ncbi:Translin-1 [Linderina macrospora]|uniref:Translin-1 n=1 Tax=Linderina macrospora TaxID=4868 RepID=A0ACC1JDQ1_9FUNG|nr:Translin-1 [Linderina macrospora]
MDVQVFVDLQNQFDSESSLREEISTATKELFKTCRLTSAKLSKAHAVPKSQSKQVTDSVKEQFATIHTNIEAIAKHVRPVTFYRYHDMWSMAVQNACALVIFAVYLEESRLATAADIQGYLGYRVNATNEDVTEFVITLEEYLHGIVSLFNELSRLAVNSVIVNDVQRPQEISQFASELYAGFQLLNLKNDSLRRRFDSIKYDIKKIEEVQYDLRVRGLIA